VSRTVWGLGFTSFFTDISSEMVSSVLPIYLVLHLRLNPVAFGVVDGLYQGIGALVRVASAFVADRWHSYKAVAAAGYAISAACKLGLLAVGGLWTALAAVIAVDRTGKGIRTAPRDALISLSSPRRDLARAFGAHRALDAGGAMLGPLASFVLLMWLPGAFDMVFVVSFCTAMIGLGVILCFVENPAREARVDASQTFSVRTAMSLFGRPGFRGCPSLERPCVWPP
jgi:hypothetical protein